MEQGQPHRETALTREQVQQDLRRLAPPVAAALQPMSLRQLVLVKLWSELNRLLLVTHPHQRDVVVEELAGVEARLLEVSYPSTLQASEDAWRPSGAARDKESLQREVLNRLPIRLRAPGSSIMHASAPQQHTKKDVTEHQSMRDIERDELFLNGVSFRGGKYGKVVKWLCDTMRALLRSVAAPPDAIDDATINEIAKLILRMANRTNSGGTAYDHIIGALAVDGLTSVAPDSNAAEPLKVDVDLGAFQCPQTVLMSPAASSSAAELVGQAVKHAWAWGLRVRINAATSYNLFDVDCEELWLRLHARYLCLLCMPVLPGRKMPLYAEAVVELSVNEK